MRARDRSLKRPCLILELESTVRGGGEETRNYSLPNPHPLPFLIIYCCSHPWYKFLSFLSLPLLLKSKMAVIFATKILSTRSSKFRLLCWPSFNCKVGFWIKPERNLIKPSRALTTEPSQLLGISKTYLMCFVRFPGWLKPFSQTVHW